jgi:hypothetical protein
MTNVCAFQDWVFTIPSMQQQSVLMLAMRGPDGITKEHPCKVILRRYRASILKSAYLGRALRVGEQVDTFHSLKDFQDEGTWHREKHAFFRNIDDLPVHFVTHLFHGCQILGYKHPDPFFRRRWSGFYLEGVEDCLHFNIETEEQMDKRLGDWGREHWELERHVYSPSAQHQGDCNVCGHGQHATIHQERANV